MNRLLALASAGARFSYRWIVPTAARYPEVVILGAQKAGTTSLYSYLAAHPGVAASLRKEVHFFDYGWNRGMRWYRAHFPSDSGSQTKRLACEASPSYLFHPLVPQRLAETLPEARFLVLLRDPVARAFSHYRHEVRKGRETLPFEDALAREAERTDDAWQRVLAGQTADEQSLRNFSYVRRGLYAEQLRRWFAVLPRERFLIVESERFFAQTRDVMSEVLRFVGLPTHDLERYVPMNQPERYSPPSPETVSILRQRFAQPNQELFQLLGTEFPWT